MMFYPLPAASIVGVFAAVKKLRPDKIKTAVITRFYCQGYI